LLVAARVFHAYPKKKKEMKCLTVCLFGLRVVCAWMLGKQECYSIGPFVIQPSRPSPLFLFIFSRFCHTLTHTVPIHAGRGTRVWKEDKVNDLIYSEQVEGKVGEATHNKKRNLKPLRKL